MRETFPHKKQGDSLAADHVNKLGDVARRVGISGAGSNLSGQQGGSFISMATLPAWMQSSALVTRIHPTDAGIFYCRLRYYDFANGIWLTHDKEWLLDGNVSASTVTVGLVVTAYWYQQRGMFLPIVEVDQPPVPFELKDDLTPGGSAVAYLRTWSVVASDWITDTDTEFTVHDRDGEYRGRAKDKYASPYDDGSVGTVRWKPDANRFEIETMVNHALTIEGLTTGTVEDGDDFTIDPTRVMSPIGSIITNTDPANPVPITNKFSHDGDSGAEVVALWHENYPGGARYVGVQMECPI